LVKPAKDRISYTAARERWQGSAQPFQIVCRLSDEMASQQAQDRMHDSFVGAKGHLAPTEQASVA
jgi:hypothetical protein